MAVSAKRNNQRQSKQMQQKGGKLGNWHKQNDINNYTNDNQLEKAISDNLYEYAAVPNINNMYNYNTVSYTHLTLPTKA